MPTTDVPFRAADIIPGARFLARLNGQRAMVEVISASIVQDKPSRRFWQVRDVTTGERDEIAITSFICPEAGARPLGMEVTPEEYRVALAALGLSQAAAGRFFGVHEITAHRWASSMPPPTAVAMLLKLMVELQFTPEYVELVIRPARPNAPPPGG